MDQRAVTWRGQAGYLWLAPFDLGAGKNTLEWRLTPEEDVPLRAYWALVADAAVFARPVRMMASDAPKKDSQLQFLLDVDLPFEPTAFTLQVSADAPCRVVVNDEEAGRQGGFDPYASLARVQPYTIRNARRGVNRIMLEMQDLGPPTSEKHTLFRIGVPVSLMADGVVQGEGEQVQYIISGSHWQVRRDSGPLEPAKLSRTQWLDPAWSHLWRRPHPLPGAMWLENKPAGDAVLPIVPDDSAGHPHPEWFRWTVPPDATEVHLPVVGEACLWIGGEERAIRDGSAMLRGTDSRVAVMRVMPKRGCTGGGVFTGPITYTIGTGQIRLGDWARQGLEAYSGGVHYETSFHLEAVPSGKVLLDLGQVRGTAEVHLNGQAVGTRVWSPYRFDVTRALQVGENTLDVLVLNTLGPYLEAVSPTFYVHPEQTVSGLFGPVYLLV
jgi:hypothetical protein